MEPIAAHCEAWSPPWSSTIRTARSRTSGEYRFDVFFVMAPSSQEVEPPGNPGRFKALQIRHRDQLQGAIDGYLAQLHQCLLNGTAAPGRDGKVSVFILGRYNADRHYVPPRWKSRYGDRMDIAFLTMHRSKGAEADYVILPGMVHNGFPNLRADDPVLTLAMPSGDTYPLGEERRLFYVALTRARRSVVMFTVRGQSSSFLDELVKERAVTVTDAEGEPVDEQRCPVCKHGVIVMRDGPYGSFQSCSSFPKCRYKPRNQRPSRSVARRYN
ncbi:3'-5' exonuclease [Roseomonas mucosa]